MKKLILLLTICILTSCFSRTQINFPLIITDIRICTECKNNKYRLNINDDHRIAIYTNIKYNIGDTLK